MNRSASEVIHNLEARIARLEGGRTAASVRGAHFVIFTTVETNGVGMETRPVSIYDLELSGSSKQFYVYSSLEDAQRDLEVFKKPRRVQSMMGGYPAPESLNNPNSYEYYDESDDTTIYISIRGFNSMAQVMAEVRGSGMTPVGI